MSTSLSLSMLPFVRLVLLFLFERHKERVSPAGTEARKVRRRHVHQARAQHVEAVHDHVRRHE